MCVCNNVCVHASTLEACRRCEPSLTFKRMMSTGNCGEWVTTVCVNVNLPIIVPSMCVHVFVCVCVHHSFPGKTCCMFKVDYTFIDKQGGLTVCSRAYNKVQKVHNYCRMSSKAIRCVCVRVCVCAASGARCV